MNMSPDPIGYFIMAILPYIAVAVFLTGSVYKIFTWFRAPTAANRFTVYPGKKNKAVAALETGKEIAFFPRILKEKKILWIGLWFFHYGLVMTLFGHTRLLAEWNFIWDILNFDQTAIDTVAFISGSIAGIIVISTALYLLARKFSGTLAKTSNFEDFFVLAVFLGIGMTGMIMRTMHVDLGEFRSYIASMLTLQAPTVFPEVGIIFHIHLFLVLLIIAILPFTKLFHLGGVFVTMYKSKHDTEEKQ